MTLRYLFIFILLSCSVKSNAQIDSTTSIFVKTYTPKQLHADIDYVRDLLTKKHPNLYWYISRAKLNYEFDSLKNAINTPLTAPQFRIKLLHVLSSIGDGHVELAFNVPNIPSADMLFLKGDKVYPIQQLTYKIIKGRLYVVKNDSGNNLIVPDTEILSIDGKPASDLISAFADQRVADGYNRTFKIGLLNLNNSPILSDFPTIYYFTYGLKQKLNFVIKQNDGLKTIELIAQDRPKLLNESPQFDDVYTDFLSNDKVAFLKISSFEWSDPDLDPLNKFFAEYKKRDKKCLIIDLRDNGGGNYKRMAHLFSMLIDKPTYLGEIKLGQLDKKQTAILSDFENGYKRPIQPNYYHFDGKLYIITNGGTFSAAALLVANLKITNRATLVGEETGGGRNGCIAGVYHESPLPGSGLIFTFGLVQFTVLPKVKQIGRGVMPDIPIAYTVDDYLKNKDLEREWIDNDIKAKGILK